MKKLLSRLEILFDQSFSRSALSQFKWLGGVVVIFFVLLMCLSYFMYDSNIEDDGSRGLITDTIMLLLDPGYATNRMSNLYTIITALCGIIIFMGMFIPIVSNVLSKRTDAYNSGTVTYNVNNHHVILGYNESVAALIQLILSKTEDHSMILLMSEKPTDSIRAKLSMNIEQQMMKQIIILNGSRNTKQDLNRTCIDNAKSLWIIGEENEEGHDSINFECAEIVAEIRKAKYETESIKKNIEKKDKLSNEFWGASKTQQNEILKEKTALYEMQLKNIQLDCHVMFEQLIVFTCFQTFSVTTTMRNFLNFHPFSPYENWAQKVLISGPEKKGSKEYYTPLDSPDGIQRESQKHVHLIVIGMGQMGQSLAIETAHTAHYPNFREDDINTRTHITFIDCNADEKMMKFKSRYPGMFDLAWTRYLNTTHFYDSQWIDPLQANDSAFNHLGTNFIDVKWEFIHGHSDSPAIRKYLIDAVNDENALTTIAICLSDSNESMRIALSLPYQAYSCQQILVYQDVYSALIDNVAKEKHRENIRQFGARGDCFEKNQIGESEGKWINYFYADNTLSMSSTSADMLWKDESVVNQWSSIHSANSIYTKMRVVGTESKTDTSIIQKVFEEHMDDLMYMEHNRWNVDKLLTGFRALTNEEYVGYKSQKYSKNFLKKELMAHLDICSFDQLKEDDPDSIKFDAAVTRALIRIIKEKVKETDKTL